MNEGLIEGFIYLLLREKEQKEDHFQVHQKAAIHELIEKYKGMTNKKKTHKKDALIIEINNYVFSEEQKEENEWESLVLYFENEEKLRTHIMEHWEEEHFMKELITFF